MAELGVVLLLFSLGLEVSFSELAPVRRVALAGGVLQIVLTIALGLGLGLALGWEWRPALWFGALISLSSTMVALKTVQAQGRLGTLSSRVMLGILVVQDLAVVPLMIVLPELSDPAGGLAKVGVAAARAAVLLGVIVLFSTKVVPRLMGWVARWNSRELFFLSTMTLAVGVGFVAWRFGLSMAIGAFVAGLVVSESEYAHQALSDVAPLRDLFGMLFFVSVGMLLDPLRMWDQLGTLDRRGGGDRRRQGADPGRHRARLRLLERDSPRRRPDAVPGRRVRVRAGPRRAGERRLVGRCLQPGDERRHRHHGAHPAGVQLGAGDCTSGSGRSPTARRSKPPTFPRPGCATRW